MKHNNKMINLLFGSKKQNKRDEGKEKVYALQRSEILDECTCNFCLSMDGLVLSPDDEMVSVDLFHDGCRGIWVEIMEEEKDPPPITGVPDEIRNCIDKKQNKLVQPIKLIVKSDGLANEEIMRRENKLLD